MPVGEEITQKLVWGEGVVYCQQCPSKQAMSEVLKITSEKSVNSFAVETATGTGRATAGLVRGWDPQCGVGAPRALPSPPRGHSAGAASLKPGLGMRAIPQP